MKRKGISVVLAAVMIAGMAAGCGAKGSSDAAERKDTKLTLIHDMNEDSAISFLEQAIEQFEEKNPDVKIDMETLSSDDYNSMLRNKIAADDVPDLFFIDDIHKKQEFIDAGICMDISGEEWLNENIKESAVEACSVDGKTWCLPFTQGGMFVIYNKDVFEAAGIKQVPDTWSGFIDTCRTIQEAGKTPIAAGFQEQWVLFSDEQCDSVVTTVKYDKENRLNLEAGTTTWAADEGHFSEVLQRMKERYQYTNDDPFGTDWNTALNMLAVGDAGMILNGSWTPAAVMGINPDANLGIFPLPLTEDSKEAMLPLRSTPGGFAVYQDSENADAALKFLEMLSTPEMGALQQKTKGDISACKNVEVTEEDGILYDVQQYIDADKVFDWTAYSELFVSDELQTIVTDVETELLMNENMTVDEAMEMLDERFEAALSAQK